MEQSQTGEKKRAFDTYHTIVDRVDELTPRNKGIHFHLQDGKTLTHKPGQFVQIFVPLPDGKIKRTSYSIASPPRQKDRFELCVTLVDGGKSSTFLHSLKPGDKVDAMGPLGVFTMPEPLPRDVVFVATGSGIAPFRSMINDLFDHNTNRTLYLIFGNRYDNDIIYQKEWEDLAAKHPNFKLLFTLSRPQKWTGKKGYVQDCIEGFVPDPKSKDFYICGLNNMITDVQNRALSLGVPKEQIHFERYD
jgi:ferredoxin-NADP reductase